VKVVLLHDADGQKLASQLLKQIKCRDFTLESFLFQENWINQTPPDEETLRSATHLVAVLPGFEPGKPCPAWFSFAAGFVLGSGVSLVCYGDGTASGPVFGGRFPYMTNGETLLNHLKSEALEWTRLNGLRQARERLLQMGVPVNEESFARCVSEKKREEAGLFLEAGFPPDTVDRAGVPVLCLAARAGDREILGALLRAGASVNLPAHDRGCSAIIDCALGKHNRLLEDLLAAGADVNVKSKDGQSPLIISVGLNDEPTVEILLKAGANADEPDSLGASARKYAALFNKPAMAALFVKYAPPSGSAS
jgi:ankyrin repeat protein